MLGPLVRRLAYFVAALELVVLSFSPAARALPNGIASGSCNSCHLGGGEPTLSVDFEPAVVAPGDLVTLTIHIKNSGLKTAGFFIQNLDFPNFSDIAGQPTQSTGDGVTHSSPIRGSGDEATVQVAWTAPSQADGTVFNLAAIAANGDLSSRGDASTWTSVGLVWGCDGITLYWDGDSDGYGSEDLGTSPGCASREHWATEKGDCDGGDPLVNPGATEICNEDDDDCDGDVDEGTNPRTLYPDADGDGFGAPGAESMVYCGSLAGYADNSDDCDDKRVEVRPGAAETCNDVDDNCDGRADEGACSTGTPEPLPSTTPTTTQPSTLAPTTQPQSTATAEQPPVAPGSVGTGTPNASTTEADGSDPQAPSLSPSSSAPSPAPTLGNGGAPSTVPPSTVPPSASGVDVAHTASDTDPACSLDTRRRRTSAQWLPIAVLGLLSQRRRRAARSRPVV